MGRGSPGIIPSMSVLKDLQWVASGGNLPNKKTISGPKVSTSLNYIVCSLMNNLQKGFCL